MTFRAAIALLIAAAFGISGASAEDFYKNKQVRLIAGFPAGNDYDLGARLLVKYLPKYIPGQPNIIVQNMPQAASVAAANYLYTQAPRDGTVLGSFSRNIVNDALTAQPNVEIDPQRMNWLGATSSLAILPTVLNKVLGTKFRIVQGYQGMGDSMLAVERGELQGLCASYQ